MCYETAKHSHAKGHMVIRLPLHNCQFYHIRLIWVKVKEKVKKNYLNDKQHLKRE